MAVYLSLLGGAGAQFFDDNGDPLSGGKIFTYVAGTTTPQTTYTTSVGDVAHTNPIILDAAGRIANSGEIWLTDGASYKFVLKTSTDVLVKTWDNITGANSNLTAADISYAPPFNSLLTAPITVSEALTNLSNSSSGSSYVGFLQSGTATVSRSVQSKLRDTVSVFDFMSAAQIASVQARNSVEDVTSVLQAAINASTGRALFFPGGTYKLSAMLQVVPGVSLIGEGAETTIFDATHSGVGIRIGFPVGSPPSGFSDVDQFSQVYEGFRVKANAGTTFALQMMRCIYCSFKNIQVLHPTTVGASYVSFRVSGAMYLNTYENCISDTLTSTTASNGKGWHIGNGQNEVVQAFAATNVNTFITCRAVRIPVGFDIDNASGCNLINPNAEENTTAGIHIRGNYNVISAPWLESASIVCAQFTAANGSGGFGAAQSPYNNTITGGAFPCNINVAYAINMNILGMTLVNLTVGATAFNTRVAQTQILGAFTNSGSDGWFDILLSSENRTIVQYGTNTVYELNASINGAVMTLSRTAISPGAAPANKAYLYTRLNAGKMQLCVNFPTGAVQVIATEP